MLVVSGKRGSGMVYGGEGIFDFGKILLKKALNSNLLKTASRAINSELGQTAVSAVKRAAESELGQELQQKAISAVKKKALDTLDSVALSPGVKKAARSELGQVLQKKIVSEVGKRSKDLGGATETVFSRLGIVEPPKKKRRKRKRKGGSLVYPQGLIDQFVGGSGIVLE
jgi:hypothetical protein